MKSSCPALCRASTSLLQPRKTWMAGTSPAMTKKEVRKVLPHHFAAALRDQPRGALIAHIDPQPADRDAEPVAQADQEVDVGDAPYPPCQGAAQLDAPEIDHRLALADLRQAAGMLVSEQSGRAAAQARLDGIRDIASLLLGGRRNAGDRLAIGAIDNNGIADGEDVGMVGHREVGQDLQAAGAV